MNRVDRYPVVVEQTDETDEPVAPGTDNCQRETINYRVVEPEPLYKLDEYASLSDNFGVR